MACIFTSNGTQSIHQYGSATQDGSSPHFDDQMDLYAV